MRRICGGAVYWSERFPRCAIAAATLLTLSVDLRPDGRMLGFAVALCVACALFAGLPAAFQATRANLHGSLKVGPRHVAPAAALDAGGAANRPVYFSAGRRRVVGLHVPASSRARSRLRSRSHRYILA